jgi:hypothetical protein
LFKFEALLEIAEGLLNLPSMTSRQAESGGVAHDHLRGFFNLIENDSMRLLPLVVQRRLRGREFLSPYFNTCRGKASLVVAPFQNVRLSRFHNMQ